MTRPYFSHDEYAARIAKTRTAMSNRGLELLIVSDPSNMAWLTGYDGWSFYVHQAVLLGLDGDPVWFGRDMDATGARRTVFMGEDDIVGYADTYVQSTERHPMDRLSEIISERGWSTSEIGVEMDNYYFSAAAFAALRQGLSEAPFTDATGLVNWQRAVKSPRELSYMRTAARIVEAMHDTIRERFEPDMRKCDLIADIAAAGIRGLPEAGGDYAALVPLALTGADAGAPHLTWDDRPLHAGQSTVFEIAGCYRRYHCPLCRTVFLGPLPDHYRRAEEAVLEAIEAGLAAARPGNRAEDIANAVLTVYRRFGFEKSSRCGYATGLSYPPDWGERTISLRPGDETVLEPGMTFHFIPALWFEDWGMEITESILITDDGVETLADYPRELFVKT